MTRTDDDHREVLRLLLGTGGITRASLAETTGWARGTVTQRLNELLAANWLVEEQVSVGAERRGRPSIVYRLNADGGLILVLAFGQTHVTTALVNLFGVPVVAKAVTFEPGKEIEDAEQIARNSAAVLDELLSVSGRSRSEVMCCVIGKPGPVDPDGLEPPTAMPGWLDDDVRYTVGDLIGMPTFVENDVNLMALGYWQAAGQPRGTIVFVKVALGMGAGILLDGQLVRGRRGMAGEIGHIPVSSDAGELCACGHTNCVTQIVGVQSLLRDLREKGMPVNSIEDLADLTGRGDPRAAAALRQAGRYVGEALLGLVATLAPDVVAIGGPLSQLGDHLVTGARETLYSRGVPALTAGMRVLAAASHRELGLRGAGLVGTTKLIDAHVSLPAGERRGTNQRGGISPAPTAARTTQSVQGVLAGRRS